jgi:hypothetical protein
MMSVVLDFFQSRQRTAIFHGRHYLGFHTNIQTSLKIANIIYRLNQKRSGCPGARLKTNDGGQNPIRSNPTLVPQKDNDSSCEEVFATAPIHLLLNIVNDNSRQHAPVGVHHTTMTSIIRAAYMPSLLLSLLLAASSAVATTYKISFSSLESAIDIATANRAVSPPRLLLEGLLTTNNPSNINGLISITDLPNNFKHEKLALLSNLHDCLISIEENGGTTTTNLVPTEHLADGTIRRSFATLTQPNEKIGAPIQSLEQFLVANTNTNVAAACVAFQSHLDSFRSTVSMVTTKFAQQLSLELEPYLPKPLLHSATAATTNSHSSGKDLEVDYQDFAQTVAGGEHLEHFHSYQKQTKKTTTNQDTIELHTDQGLFIAFTPGLLLPAASSVGGESLLALSKGLVIQDSDGKNHVVEFTNDDDLVFMMGDGVNQV